MKTPVIEDRIKGCTTVRGFQCAEARIKSLLLD